MTNWLPTELASRLTRTPRFDVENHVLLDCDLDESAPVFHVDCYGRSFYRRVEVAHRGTRWVFHYDSSRRLGVSFRAGMFFDRAAVPGSHLWRVPKARRAAVLVETPNEYFFDYFPELASSFCCVMTHRDDFVGLGHPFTRLHYGTNWVPIGDPELLVHGHGKTKDLSFLGSIQHEPVHGYVFRKQVAERLQALGIECFGRGLKTLASKTDGLDPYRFSVAMENTRSSGYFTEKLIDCFHRGTVPVYWGDPAIASVFDPRGMIVFENLDGLESILPTLGPDRYKLMLPYVVANLERAIALDLADTAGMYRRIAARLEVATPEGHSRTHGQVGRLARGIRHAVLGLRSPGKGRFL
ncbi:glycosyltransferase family 10 domain-containing protein [Planctomycetes bacterium TBK1r]|uniref:Glycosyltransferase family 10 (Fucosyltransferase) n=1 Tax=Stieleria magnilauensis TaxID=2527963 RepID=A0ABX5XLY1_9BACT|nr:Glycosyltransferase family 10 (fucosyltransferase) [Planctomycetes bacterium TBK1r]